MVFSKMLRLCVFPLLSISFAAPTPEIVASSTAPIDWIPVVFEGKTLYVNNAAIVNSSINPAKKAARSLLNRRNDSCGGSSFHPHPGPYPTTGDCGVIRDWALGRSALWEIWNNTPDTHGLWYYGSCVFEVGTRNIVNTYIGSTDVGDITRDAINMFQYGGVIAAQGSMGCKNGQRPAGISLTNWKIKHS